MSVELNQVVMAVNLGADAEQRFTTDGRSIVNFRGATTRKYTVNGEKREDTSWFRFVIFGEMGQRLHQYLVKGKPVIVIGSLSQRTYEDKDGNKRESVEIVVQRLQLMGDGQRDTNNNNSSRSTNTRTVAVTDDDDMDEIPF